MKTNMKKMLCLVMALMMVLCFAGCGAPDEIELITVTDGETIGEGAAQFPLTIVDKDGAEIKVTVNTDEETVGNALIQLGLIAGEESEYGIYVKTVNNQFLDYETDGMYWAFYVDGAYANVGVDQTEIKDGEAYELRAE